MHTRVAAVIVTYHSGEKISALLQALIPQLERVYIIDNGSDAATRNALQDGRQRYAGQIELILNDVNRGLAAAQNQGIRQALAQGCEWVLLLDDDSLPAPDMVARLLAAWEHRQPSPVGIVAPQIVEQNVTSPCRYLMSYGPYFLRRPVQSGHTLAHATMVIASGSLIRSEVFYTAGLMNEGYFIDSVDHEFCLRARRHGFGILVVGDSLLHHRQGEKRRYRLLGSLTVITSGHSAQRRYYMFRNRLFLLRRYGRDFLFLWLYLCQTYAWDVLRILAYESAKREKLAAAWRGGKDGLTQPVPVDTLLSEGQII